MITVDNVIVGYSERTQVLKISGSFAGHAADAQSGLGVCIAVQ